MVLVVLDPRRQAGAERGHAAEDDVVAEAPHEPDVVAREDVGVSREKYSHHAQNVISTPPAMTAASAAGGCSLSIATWRASATDSTVSPSTMMKNSPYRSAMWCGCHGVAPACSA